MSFNENNYYLILNYFILLEVYKMDYRKTNEFYLKYFSILNQKFLNCIFLISDNDDKKIFKNINNDILSKAKEIMCINKKSIFFIYEYDFLWSRKVISIPFVYFFKGNISLLSRDSIVIDQNITNKSNLFLEISNFAMEEKKNIVCLFKKNMWSLTEKQLINKNFFNIIGITNLPIGYCYNKKQEHLYDWIIENGLIISYVSNMNYVNLKNKNLDFIISGLFCDAYVFVDSNNLNYFLDAFKIIEKRKLNDYIFRNSLDHKNDDLYRKIKLEFIDSIMEFETKNQVFFYIKNIKNNL